MDAIVKEFLSQITLGEPTQHHHMTVVPLFGPTDGPFYLTLSEALGEGLLRVSEINESGSVPELSVENKADLPVLLLDGEEFAGARQNRVLNTTILLKAQSVTTIPVSCTEQGRWSYLSAEFAESGNVMPPCARSTKNRSVSRSLKTSATYRSDQGAVWDSVDDIQSRAAMKSPTSAMRDVYESRQSNLEDYLTAFSITENQTGLLVMIGGAVVGLDILSRPEAFQRIGPKLIKSYAMEAILSRPEDPRDASIDTAVRFVEQAWLADARCYESVGHGHDCRLESEYVVGSALVYHNHVIHAAIFPGQASPGNERMSGPSRRRRNRM